MTITTDALPSEAFEEWASEEGINNFHFNHCWAAWQAALAAAPAAIDKQEAPPFLMSLLDVVEMWNSTMADSFEGELMEFAVKAINFYKDSRPGSAEPSNAQHFTQQARDAAAKLAQIQGAAPSVEQDERGAFDIALNALAEYQANWDTGLVQPYAESERIAMECAVEAVREALYEVRATSTSANAQNEIGADTGNAEADRIIGRLSSSDPDFDDCIDAVAFIRKVVAEHKGPDGFATWRDAAIAERMRRKSDSEALRSLFLEALDFGIGFGPRLSEVGEWKETRLSKANGLVIRAASPSANVAQTERALTDEQRKSIWWAVLTAEADEPEPGSLMHRRAQDLRALLTAPQPASGGDHD